MKAIDYRKILDYLERNSTKIYLIIANIFLIIFGIWFSNVGLLPFQNLGDFIIFAILVFILAIYRPSWTFAFFIGSLALENINLAPKSFSLMLRPYQLFGFVTLASLLLQLIVKRLNFSLPRWKWQDVIILVFGVAGLLGGLLSNNRAMSVKQAAIMCSFIALYFLARIYIQTLDDIKRIAPFFISSAFIIAIYSVWQNIEFLRGLNAYEVMPGRPNGTLPEPDWLGMYFAFMLAVIFSVIHFALQKATKKWMLVLSFIFLFILYVGLILTVSRSAWVGAILITIGFLKVVLINHSLNPRLWNCKKFSKQFVLISFIFIASLLLSTKLTRFQIFNRAQSTGGIQKITIACKPNHSNVPSQISDIGELSNFGCKHINLEDIELEKKLGSEVFEIKRNDPTVSIRSQIYQKSIEQIKLHPLFGIGWGSISKILGNDERGAGLNASNIFLEIWLGSGIIGILAFTIVLLWILFKGISVYFNQSKIQSIIVFLLLGLVAVIVPNLFNSGIFLGFLWIYLAISVNLLSD